MLSSLLITFISFDRLVCSERKAFWERLYTISRYSHCETHRPTISRIHSHFSKQKKKNKKNFSYWCYVCELNAIEKSIRIRSEVYRRNYWLSWRKANANLLLNGLVIAIVIVAVVVTAVVLSNWSFRPWSAIIKLSFLFTEFANLCCFRSRFR